MDSPNEYSAEPSMSQMELLAAIRKALGVTEHDAPQRVLDELTGSLNSLGELREKEAENEWPELSTVAAERDSLLLKLEAEQYASGAIKRMLDESDAENKGLKSRLDTVRRIVAGIYKRGYIDEGFHDLEHPADGEIAKIREALKL